MEIPIVRESINSRVVFSEPRSLPGSFDGAFQLSPDRCAGKRVILFKAQVVMNFGSPVSRLHTQNTRIGMTAKVRVRSCPYGVEENVPRIPSTSLVP